MVLTLKIGRCGKLHLAFVKISRIILVEEERQQGAGKSGRVISGSFSPACSKNLTDGSGQAEGIGTVWHHNTPFFNGGLVIRVSPQFFCALISHFQIRSHISITVDNNSNGSLAKHVPHFIRSTLLPGV